MGNMFKCALKQGGSGGSGADLIVTCSAEFAGATITASKTGSTSQTQTCPSTSPYVVTFSGLDNGTWTVSGTISGQTYSVQATITDFSAILNPGFNWQAWVDSAQYLDSSDYNDLDEVLEDEEALRELFLEHNCVDYLADVSTASADVIKIFNTDLAAKWINNSDYALDTLSANAEIKAVMDTADKYGYGEWCLMPQVPKMTSNTAPYGEASATASGSSGTPWKAFNESESVGWNSGVTAFNNDRVQYHFVSPIIPRKAKVKFVDGSARAITHTVKFVASNDGTTWVDISEEVVTGTINQWKEVDLTAAQSYSYVGMVDINSPTGHNADAGDGFKLQFYAYAPKGNVPVMTANNAPYGTVSASSTSSGYDAYKAFDGDDSTNWRCTNTTVGNKYSIVYKFTNPTCIKKILINKILVSSNPDNDAFTVTCSNDGTNYSSPIASGTALADGLNHYFDATNDNYYLYVKVEFTATLTNTDGHIAAIQFYGRQLSVSVPVMTGNTTPYGEASASGANSGYEAYKAFDGNTSTYWVYASSSGYIQYHFTKKIAVKKMVVKLGSGARFASYTLKGSNDGTNFTDLVSGTNSQTGVLTIEKDVPNDTEYEYLRLDVTSNESAVGEIQELDFYGLDYSEKEFEQGTTKKWLYDHGVELETMGIADNAVKLSDCIQLNGLNSRTNATIDTTNYSLVRAKVGINGSGGSVYLRCGSGQSLFTSTNMSNTNSLDASSITGSNNVGSKIHTAGDGVFDLAELWLE